MVEAVFSRYVHEPLPLSLFFLWNGELIYFEDVHTTFFVDLMGLYTTADSAHKHISLIHQAAQSGPDA